MLLYFWAPWCPVCLETERDVLGHSGVAAAVRAAFVPVKVNHDHSPELIRHYGVRSLPTVVVLAPDGTPLDRVEGRMAPQQLGDRLERLASHVRRPEPSQPPPAQNYTAGSPGIQPAVAPVENPPLGLEGYCAVTLNDDLLANRRDRWVLGRKAHGVIHRGRTYLFADAAKAARFFQEPDRYAPLLAGQDVVLAVDEGRPVQGLREHGAFFGNQIYLFASEQTLQRFENNPNRYAEAATRLSSRPMLSR